MSETRAKAIGDVLKRALDEADVREALLIVTAAQTVLERVCSDDEARGGPPVEDSVIAGRRIGTNMKIDLGFTGDS